MSFSAAWRWGVSGGGSFGAAVVVVGRGGVAEVWLWRMCLACVRKRKRKRECVIARDVSRLAIVWLKGVCLDGMRWDVVVGRCKRRIKGR